MDNQSSKEDLIFICVDCRLDSFHLSCVKFYEILKILTKNGYKVMIQILDSLEFKCWKQVQLMNLQMSNDWIKIQKH